MAESDSDSFILIEQTTEMPVPTATTLLNNIQLAQSLLCNVSNTGPGSKPGSIDGWSEISAPSNKSIPNVTAPISSFSVFSGTYLHNSTTTIPGLKADLAPNCNHTFDTGFYIIPPSDQDIFLSKSTSNDENQLHHNIPNNDHSIGSVGSRVPFSWAEITKIQPLFHTDNNPKVFEETPKITTRYTANTIPNRKRNKVQQRVIGIVKKNPNDDMDHHDMMPSIPEANPFATKSDLGRRIRRSGKRGSRLKYPNGKRGSKRIRNARKKSSK